MSDVSGTRTIPPSSGPRGPGGNRRGPPQLPPEEPAVPLEPGVAKARATYVRNAVDKIFAGKRAGKSNEEIEEEVALFAKDYPFLFKKVLAMESPNDPNLRTMIAMLEGMGRGDLTQDQASGIVGQRLYDRYIKPNLGAGDGSV
jgi:hypothetical protein